MMKFSDIIEDEVGRHVGYAINLVLYFPFLLSIIYIKELFNFITYNKILQFHCFCFHCKQTEKCVSCSSSLLLCIIIIILKCRHCKLYSVIQ